jgi:hypothetical protein
LPYILSFVGRAAGFQLLQVDVNVGDHRVLVKILGKLGGLTNLAKAFLAIPSRLIRRCDTMMASPSRNSEERVSWISLGVLLCGAVAGVGMRATTSEVSELMSERHDLSLRGHTIDCIHFVVSYFLVEFRSLAWVSAHTTGEVIRERRMRTAPKNRFLATTLPNNETHSRRIS